MSMIEPSTRFPFGVVLYREPAPSPNELQRDIQILRQQGIRLVGFPVNWAILQPAQGDWQWDVYESWLEHARQLGMEILPVFQSQHVPAWVSHPAYHPESFEAWLGFVRGVVERWGAWTEVAVWGVDWSGVTHDTSSLLQSFAQWLEDHFGSLSTLNGRWKTAFSHWEDIQPEKWRPEDVPQQVAWHAFLEDLQTEQMNHLVKEIRLADPRGRAVGSFLLEGKGREVPADFPGVSCFPTRQAVHPWDDAAAHPEKHIRQKETVLARMLSVAFVGDHSRRLGENEQGFWLAPLQAGAEQTLWQAEEPLSPEELRRWVLTALSTGAAGVLFSGVRPGMNPYGRGFSLLESEGESSPRLREAALLAKALEPYADLFTQGHLADVQVGIVLDDLNRRVCESLPGMGEHYHYSVRGWHRLLWEEGFPMDFVPASLVDESLAERYRALVLPFPLALEDETARRLSAYVSAGGNLVSEVGAGMLNEDGWAVSGEFSPLLRYLFGVRVVNQRLIGEPEESPRWSIAGKRQGGADEPGYLEGRGPMEGLRVRANWLIQQYENQGSQPVFWYRGRPAGSFRVGVRGQAWLIGTVVGHSAFAHVELESRLFVHRLMEWFGVHPQRIGNVLVRSRVSGNREAWFLTNPTAETVTAQISLPGQWGEDLLGLPLEWREGKALLTLKPFEVRVILANSDKQM
ncbi:beta-galactosidase [Anaerolinea thermophila]|uniref:beta-galactosidase n=1 Tax=Anaerolinea thermophila (strain DSM 14523 / JCM 11388 / NBRC 100420 / UNI-1) TaxID=926569 RepID=E8N2N0_ANATU|nr:beta-galactosidase [Anaerolinea thermophila]BAJ62836.1 hypothetical protein ANT_08020 [Anaerolinea thermophila UNI-1]